MLLLAFLLACSARQPVLPPPAPAATAPRLPVPAPEPAVEAARQAEEAIEQVDVSALQKPAPAQEVPAPAAVARLRARVVDAAGQPVRGALVILHSLVDGEEHRAVTGADGGVVLGGLAPGDYLLGCDPAENPEVASIPLRLDAGEAPATIEIRLAPRLHQGEMDRRELSRPQVLA